MPYMTVAAIETATANVASSFPALAKTINLPESSVEGRAIKALRVGGSAPGSTRAGVLLVGGIHAREFINPETLVEFATRLCAARAANTGLAFGPKTYTSADVRLVMDTLDIIVLPMANPDGRLFCQSSSANLMWRKNRALNPGKPCRGVDLNRNANFLWSSGIGTSADSCSDVFKGPSAFSEPETRNVRWLIDSYPRLGCMLDVHSYSELVLFPWGDDELQTTDPNQNFQNPAFNGQRGVVGSGYREYMPAADLGAHQAMGNRMRNGIAAVRGRSYTVQQSISLYPTTGTWHDYAYSRHFVQTGRRRILGFTLETARQFQPSDAEKAEVIRETQAGLMECLLQNVCPAEAVEVMTKGEAFALEPIRKYRDQKMLRSAKGRRIENDFRRHAGEVVGLLSTNQRALEAARAALRSASLLATSSDKPIADREAKALDDVLRLLGSLGSQALKADIAKALTSLGGLRGGVLDKIFKPDVVRSVGTGAAGEKPAAKKPAAKKPAAKKSAAKKSAAKKSGKSRARARAAVA